MQLGMIGLGRMGATSCDDRCATATSASSMTVLPASSRRWPARARPVSARCRRWQRSYRATRGMGVVPAGEITSSVIAELGETLESGDTVIDGGNSYYRDDIRHAKQLAEHGIRLLDCGPVAASGGWTGGIA